MAYTGGCYCGEIHERPVILKVRCSVTAESANTSQADIQTRSWCLRKNFRYTKGSPSEFSRSDLERPVTRAFARRVVLQLARAVRRGPIR